MIQNSPKGVVQELSCLSPGEDCSEPSNKLSYTQMIEGIDQEELSCQRDSVQLSRAQTNTQNVLKGHKTERFHNTVMEDLLQRSQIYIQKGPSYNRPILQRYASNQQSEMSRPVKSLFDNLLAVKNFPERNLSRHKRTSQVEQKFTYLEPEKILGREIISSVVKSNHQEQPEQIEEGSQIIDNIVSSGKRSHFKIEIPEVASANIFQQFQQRKKTAHVSPPQEIKITITPEPNKRSSHFTLRQGGPNGITFGVGNSKVSMRSQSRQVMMKKSSQNMKILSSVEKASDKDNFNSIPLKGSKIKRVENNMIQSKIITQRLLNQPEKRNQLDSRMLQKEMEQKKQIIQVADRMKYTIDPKAPTSEFKVVPVQTNLSEPDRHSAHNVPQQNAKITEPLSPSQDSPQKKEIEGNISPDIQGYLMTKIQSIEKLVDNLKKCPQCQGDHMKGSLPQGEIKIKQRRPKKREAENKIISDQFFNGLSSIDSDQKSKPRKISLDRHEKNQQFDKKFQLFAERILKTLEIGLNRVASNECNCEYLQEEILPHDHVAPKLKRRNSSSRTKVLKRVKSDTRIYEPIFQQESIDDEDFTKLNSLPRINFKLKRNSSNQEVAKLGKTILSMFRIRTEKGYSMDVVQIQNGIDFYYQPANVFIRLEYSGYFYIGGGEYVQYLYQFVKQGDGIEIVPNQHTFHGEFHDDKKEGQGIISYVSGDKYKGKWVNNMYEGQGVLYSDSSRYNGTFQEGKKHGLGKEIYKNGDTYEGYYYLGNRQGSGKYIWSNGTSYVGNFEKDKMSGKGFWRSQSGDTYEGQFYNDIRHGQGKYKRRNGEIVEGQFNQGKLVRRSCKGVLPLEKELNFDSFDDESPRVTINSGFSPKQFMKGKKTMNERQSSFVSPMKGKKFSAKW